MKILGIDDEKCIKCLECVKECEPRLYYKPPTKIGDRRRVFFEDPHHRCTLCGHCIAVCPCEAIVFEDAEQPFTFEGIKSPSSLVSYESLIKILRARRSIRRFKSHPVPKEEISAVMEAMRHAPSANNAQSWEYIVIEDPKRIEKIRNEVVKMMNLLRTIIKFRKIVRFFVPKQVKKMLKDPATKLGVEEFFKQINEGKDPVFYSAPVVIIIHAPENGSMAGVDAGIALTYGMLAAQSRNLGTCWIGYAQESLRRSKKARKELNISKENNVNGVLILGYPAVKFYRVPPRNPLKIQWY